MIFWQNVSVLGVNVLLIMFVDFGFVGKVFVQYLSGQKSRFDSIRENEKNIMVVPSRSLLKLMYALKTISLKTSVNTPKRNFEGDKKVKMQRGFMNKINL